MSPAPLQPLSDEELMRLATGGDPVLEVEPKTIKVSGVNLQFYPQHPSKSIELIMAIAEAVKDSTAVDKSLGLFVPQLKGHLKDLSATGTIEVIGGILTELGQEIGGNNT